MLRLEFSLPHSSARITGVQVDLTFQVGLLSCCTDKGPKKLQRTLTRALAIAKRPARRLMSVEMLADVWEYE